MVCAAHASKPNAALAEKAKSDPKQFVGTFVKKGFDVRHPETQKPHIEHMWVKIAKVVKGNLVGKLDNDPIFDTDLKCGDTVTVKPEEIEDHCK
jgi:uncharacterized protein YegJ (DUF2314 family)